MGRRGKANLRSNNANAPMPDIDNLKKQAKRYVRWHRARYHPVAAQIRSLLPGREHLSDQDILEAAFKLSDGQALVARKHGLESWAALTEWVKTMPATTSSHSNRSVVLSAEPQLFVTDLEVALRFYVDLLKFQVAFSYGQPAFYAQVFRDNGRLNLRQIEGPVFNDALRTNEQDILSATLTLDDAKPIFLEFQQAGVPFHQALRTEPWGARTFIIEDPDGNLIAFAGKDG